LQAETRDTIVAVITRLRYSAVMTLLYFEMNTQLRTQSSTEGTTRTGRTGVSYIVADQSGDVAAVRSAGAEWR
jgi:hypothetical protein